VIISFTITKQKHVCLGDKSFWQQVRVTVKVRFSGVTVRVRSDAEKSVFQTSDGHIITALKRQNICHSNVSYRK